MNRLHRIVACLAAVPLAVAGSVLTAPAASARLEVASFSGSFHSTCTLPWGPEGAIAGPYRCNHTATSVGCAAVVDSDSSHANLCRADLLSGSTAGWATPTLIWYGDWTCDYGSGTGTFRYQPSPSASAFTFPVTLDVVDNDTIQITGYYFQGDRTIVVRATMPARCTYDTNWPAGYHGAVTPA
jgi:hypothetical protein